MKNISLVERNYNGSIVIRGLVGKRIYYFYSKVKAIQSYMKECKKEIRNNG